VFSRRRKKLIIAFACLLLFSAGLWICFSPRPIIQDPYDAQIDFVSYMGSDAAGFDETEIISLLSEYQCKRTLKSHFPYDSSMAVMEIDGTNSKNPLHIILYEDSAIYYISADKDVFDIIDNDKALKEKLLRYISIE